MFRKSVALLVVLMLVITALAGCAPAAPADQPLASADQPADKPADQPVAPPAAKDVVKIGFLAPITGPNAAEGAAARNAFQLCIDEANNSGEFPYTIECIMIDDASTPATGAAGAQQIVADPLVVAATGHWNSGVAEATIPIFKSAEIPMLIWGAIRESLTSAENYPWITRSAPTDKQENIPLAKAVIDDMGYKDFFIVSDVTSYGEGNTEAFTAELAARGLKPLGVEKVQEGTVDFRSIIAKVKSSGAKAVYFGGVVTEGSLLKNQLFEQGVTDILFCGISGTYSPDFLKIDAKASEGALVVKPGVDPETNATAKAFVDKYAAAGFSEPVGAYTPYAYEAGLILLNALRACGDKPTPALMVDAIRNSKTEGIMGTTTFNEIGQTTNVAAYLNVVQDGAWIAYDASEYKSGTRAFGGK